MGDIKPEDRARGRARMIAHYKHTLSGLWARLEPEWATTYAYDDGGLRNEQWPGHDLWSTRYGSLSESGGIDSSGAFTTTSSGDVGAREAAALLAAAAQGELYADTSSPWAEGAHDAAANRSGYAARLTNDGINAIEQMADAEFDEWAYDADGNWKGVLPASTDPTFGSRAVFEKLKAHLIDTRGHSGEDRVANTLAASDDHNMLTGNLLDRSNKEDTAAAKPPANDKQKDTISRAGIAYDTIEYREQCFLLSQIFKIVEHKIDIIEEDEYKRLPYVDEGVTIGEGEEAEPIAPTNACLMVDSDTPYAFINRLTQYPAQQSLINIKTSDLSQLQPQIRLFRVTPGDSSSQMSEFSQEMVFDTATTRSDLEEFMKPTGKRGFGAGIKSFNVAYEASNPFALKKSISAELTIFANTFDELTRDRGGYSYIDLALKTGGGEAAKQKIMENVGQMSFREYSNRLYNLSKLNFRLKAVVGWMKPPGVQGLSNSQVAEMLNTSFVTLNLTPTIHTFDFDDMGRVIFKIQYLAYIDDFFDEPSYSIFSDYTLVQRQKEREVEWRAFKENCDSEGAAKFKEKMGVEVAKELAQQRASMWKELKKSDRLRFINLKYSTLRKFQEKGPDFDLFKAEAEALDINNLRNATKGQAAGLANAIEEYAKNPTAKGHGHKDKKNANSTQQIALVYFYVSDLLDIILAGIDRDLEEQIALYVKLANSQAQFDAAAEARKNYEYEKNRADPWQTGTQTSAEFQRAEEAFNKAHGAYHELRHERALAQLDLERTIRLHDNFKRYRVLLGPIEIINPSKPAESRTVNIGDLPVSFKYFMEWLTGRTLAKDRPYYPIAAFMNDFINGLINGFINDGHCFPRGRGQTKQKTFLNQAAITAYTRPSHFGTQAPTDSISQLLRSHRITTHSHIGYDTARLHLEEHDAARYPDANITLPIDSWPLLEMSGPPGSPITERGLKNEMNYICYYAGRTEPQEQMNGDLSEDISRGVMHYMAGKDNGIVKNIKFQKTEAPGLKEVRYEQDGYDGLAQLREVYNVTINTYANIAAFPGSYIFVNPKGLVPNMTFNSKIDPLQLSAQELSTYGIGGYYMIIRSSHQFGAGQADTTIDAVWVSQIEGTGTKKKEQLTPKEVEQEQEYKQQKCKTLLKANNLAGRNDNKKKEPKDTVGQKQ